MACVETLEPLAGYRPCVGVFLLNDRGQVLVGQRRDMAQDAWQMPQGGIDPPETPVEAGLREMLEEIGTDRALLLRQSGVWRSYELPESLARKSWRGRYADIRLDTAHPEFSAWRWAPPEAVGGLIVPFKRDVYVSVVAEFRPLWV